VQDKTRAHAAGLTAAAIVANIERVLVGKRPQVELALAAAIAGGHVLLEDVPGSGKTMLARALAISSGLDFKRIQFTADMMPSDILGGPVYNPRDGSFTLRRGPVFASVVLADEINRANPRAQSALLECMEEGQVTLDGQTLPLPQPFVVLATQNPVEMAGTWPLPEAQRDRFLVRLSLGYPTLAQEAGLIAAQQLAHPIRALESVCTPEQFRALAEAARAVTLSDELARYIAGLSAATRRQAGVRHGASPRGTLALARMARALSCVRGEAWVDPATVRELAVPVLAHRLVLQPEREPHEDQALVQAVLAAAPAPR
jgi:MoxR-like ATPase